MEKTRRIMSQKDKIDLDIEKRIKKYNYPDTLYHYTSMQVLFSIIKNKELWMGSAAFMNDKEEVTYFINQLESALLKNLPDAKIQECRDFFTRVRSKILYPYIICFSQQDDDAAQWERYADDAKGCDTTLSERRG